MLVRLSLLACSGFGTKGFFLDMEADQNINKIAAVLTQSRTDPTYNVRRFYSLLADLLLTEKY